VSRGGMRPTIRRMTRAHSLIPNPMRFNMVIIIKEKNDASEYQN
jgi:hypothetical protein